MVLPSSELSPELSVVPNCQKRSPAMPASARDREVFCQGLSMSQWSLVVPSMQMVNTPPWVPETLPPSGRAETTHILRAGRAFQLAHIEQRGQKSSR